jgi:CHAD domain-containing protein
MFGQLSCLMTMRGRVLIKNLFERKRKGRQFKKFAAAFEEFQDQLGALDGLTTAMQMLERLGVVNDPGAVTLLSKDT